MSILEIPLRTLPMKAAGTQHLIERTYRESGTFQWVRETLRNALESGATRLEFGIEWQAVEESGVYRRVIADDGCGMPYDRLQEFFNTFGGGGKPIGGLHENFGVGAKTSLLPWNQYGLVVISWVGGDASMIWVQRDPVTGEYGLRLFAAVDENGQESLEAVVEPFNDPDHGCNWAAVKPDWVTDHGTVLVLLGNTQTDDTVLGDPNRAEADIKGISSFLNRRTWQLPEGVEVTVEELRTVDRGNWPRSEKQAHTQPKAGYDRRTNLRGIEGARYFVEYPPGFSKGHLQDQGTVTLSHGTEIDWFLWEGERPAVQSYAAISGFIAALYQDELYDVSAHHSTYRSFGISETAVRLRVWLIVRPPLADDEGGKRGVYPRTDRNSLLLRGGPNAGSPLPFNDWGGEFADAMPDPIRAALRALRAGSEGGIDDPAWRERLAERFGSRWRVTKLRVATGGTETVTPTQNGGRPRTTTTIRKKKRTRGSHRAGGAVGALTMGSQTGQMPASKVKVGGGIPRYKTVGRDQVGPGMMAAWMPNDPDYPEGVVLINTDHAVLEAQILYWQSQYADHHADSIRQDVVGAYGEIAVAKVAHSEFLRNLLPSDTIDNELRSEAALTMALLGLMAEEAVISTRVGGKYGKRRAIA